MIQSACDTGHPIQCNAMTQRRIHSPQPGKCQHRSRQLLAGVIKNFRRVMVGVTKSVGGCRQVLANLSAWLCKRAQLNSTYALQKRSILLNWIFTLACSTSSSPCNASPRDGNFSFTSSNFGRHKGKLKYSYVSSGLLNGPTLLAHTITSSPSSYYEKSRRSIARCISILLARRLMYFMYLVGRFIAICGENQTDE